MLIEGLFGYLTANTGVKSALGYPRKDNTTGVWAGLTPDEVMPPAIAVNQITGMPLQESFQGTGALQTSRWRFSCYGSTYKSAKLLAQAVKQALIAMDGTLPTPSGSTGNAEVHGSWFRLEVDEQEPIPHGTLYSTHVDFEINFLDLVP